MRGFIYVLVLYHIGGSDLDGNGATVKRSDIGSRELRLKAQELSLLQANASRKVLGKPTFTFYWEMREVVKRTLGESVEDRPDVMQGATPEEPQEATEAVMGQEQGRNRKPRTKAQDRFGIEL
jgi:hypothetical protein